MIEPIHFFESAEKTISLGEEVDFRNSVSRAYYAAYHFCIWLDEQHNVQNHAGINNGGVHEQFISKLKNCLQSHTNFDYKKIRAIGIMLDNAKKSRHKADYRLSTNVIEQDAKNQIELVRKIFEIVAGIKS